MVLRMRVLIFSCCSILRTPIPHDGPFLHDCRIPLNRRRVFRSRCNEHARHRRPGRSYTSRRRHRKTRTRSISHSQPCLFGSASALRREGLRQTRAPHPAKERAPGIRRSCRASASRRPSRHRCSRRTRNNCRARFYRLLSFRRFLRSGGGAPCARPSCISPHRRHGRPTMPI